MLTSSLVFCEPVLNESRKKHYNVIPKYTTYNYLGSVIMEIKSCDNCKAHCNKFVLKLTRNFLPFETRMIPQATLRPNYSKNARPGVMNCCFGLWRSPGDHATIPPTLYSIFLVRSHGEKKMLWLRLCTTNTLFH